MDRKKLIKKYIKFFEEYGHKKVPNSSLVPENDSSVLFITAGMHPLVPFLLGQKHPQGKRLVGVQRCIRTGDIEEVGDEVHHTFFEMLGNWSLGEYWKEDAIKLSFEFLTKKLKIPKESISVTCFAGDKDAGKDEESEKIWKELGISSIEFLGKKDNWWGPAGTTGPCGPDSEMFVNGVEIWNDVFMEYMKDKRLILVDGMNCLYDKNFNLNKGFIDLINGHNSHFILVVNGFREKGKKLVKGYDKRYSSNWEAFSLEEEGIKKDNPEYFKRLMKSFNLVPEEIIYFDHKKENVDTAKKLGILSKQYKEVVTTRKFIEGNLWGYFPSKQKNVDTGMGVERTVAIMNDLKDNYLGDSFKPIIKKIEKLSKKKYEGNLKAFRIIADHIKASVFILGDGIVPKNTEHGYVLRRLIRRAVKYGKDLGLTKFTAEVAEPVFEIYDDYEILKKNKKSILNELTKEEDKFNTTLEKGINMFEKITKGQKSIDPKNSFLLYQSYGFPVEMIEEECKKKGITFSREGFDKEVQSHQKLSRTAAAGKFKSGLADESEKTTRLHTATHLLLAALKQVLKDPNIIQKGSNINPERARFDFSFPRKLEKEEVWAVETLVNEWIQKAYPVTRQEMTLDQAKKAGAAGIFDEKYGDKVSVYTIDKVSKELCTGPHVENTKEIGKFKIKKEESSSSGVRRIKAVLE